MESFKCNQTGCNREAEENCTCGVILCESHTHRSVKGHSFTPLRMELHSSLKTDIRKSILNCLEKCSSKQIELQRQSQKSIASILEETSIAVQRIKIVEMELLELLHSLGRIDILVLKGSRDYKSRTLADYIGAGGRFAMVSELEQLNSDVLYSLVNKEIIDGIEHSPLQVPSPYIVCFRKASKELQILNVTDMKIKTTNAKALMGSRAGWCLLPDGRIFHYGGWIADTKNSSICAIINPEQKSIELMKSNHDLRNIGQCSYYKGDVYMFGGHNEDTFAKSFKYSILKNEWQAITPMPSLSRDCNSTVLGSTIVIGGMKHESLLLYGPSTDTYRKSLELSEKKYKIVWTGNRKVFVLWCGKIFESKPFDLNTWKCVANNLGIEDARLMGLSVRWGNWVYLLLENRNLYKFNLFTKTIEIVSAEVKIYS